MIMDGEKWNYCAIRSLSTLLKEIMSNHNEEFYCLNCFYSYRNIINLKDMKKCIINMITVT